MLEQPDGKILLGGQLSSGTTVTVVIRINQDGSRDTNFIPVRSIFSPPTGSSATTVYVHPIALQEDGWIVIGGIFTSINGAKRSHLARVKADGTLDTSFAPEIHRPPDGPAGTEMQGVEQIAIQPDGKILIRGGFDQVNGEARPGLARLNSDGSLDSGEVSASDFPADLAYGVVWFAWQPCRPARISAPWLAINAT